MVTGATALSSPARVVFPVPPLARQFSNPIPAPPLPISPWFPSLYRAGVSCDLRNQERQSFVVRSVESIGGGFWEEPDDGYSSEDDRIDETEMDEGERRELVFTGASNASDFNFEYEQLVEEVESLLEPDERSILQQNEFPNISKISTMKWSLFHSLGLSLQIQLMDELLKHGWDIDSVDKDGLTALHKAVLSKKESVISHLLRKGANPHVKDRAGATALHYAVQAGAMQTVKLLIKYKVDVNIADNDGWTPLHISMQIRSREIAKFLLVNGADKTRRNKDGKSPLDLSLCYGRDFKSYELAKLLKLVPANRET